MKIFGFQFCIAWEDPQANFARVGAMARDAGPPPGSLLILPEMFATGFSMNTDKIAEDEGGPTHAFLAALAAEHECWVAGGAPIRGKDGNIRNSALVFSPGGKIATCYSKMRLFRPGNETEHYCAGETPCVFNCGPALAAPFICYDLRFPELFREAARQWQPHLYIVMASWPSQRIAHWIRLLQARAIENQAFVAGINRTGPDLFHEYCGRSLIADFHGEIVADAGTVENVISAELDFNALAQYRTALPFLRDLQEVSPGTPKTNSGT